MATANVGGGQAVTNDNSRNEQRAAYPNPAAGDLFFSAGAPAQTPSRALVTPSMPAASTTMVLFQEPDVSRAVTARRARRADAANAEAAPEVRNAGDDGDDVSDGAQNAESPRRSRRGSRGGRRSGAESRDMERENAAANAADTAVEDSGEADGKEALAGRSASSTGTASKKLRTRSRTRTARGSDEENANVESGAVEESDEDAGRVNEGKKRKGSSHAQTPSGDAVASAVTVRKRRRRTAGSSGSANGGLASDVADQVTAPKGSTRLEAKRQRRKEGREAGRRRHTITESEFLARRESVNREMLIRERDGLNQIAVLEDGVLVEHYVARHTQSSMVGNVYLGRVQNVLPSMEAAFVDIGKGRNAVLYAGEVNWDVAGLEGKPRRIEEALKSGDTVLVQVTKDPIGHKGARLTSQITLAGRHLVLVPNGAMTGISRKLPEKERARLKKILRGMVAPEHGVIVRTAAEGASEEQLQNDVNRLTQAWKDIEAKSKSSKNAPSLLKGEPELAVRVVRDVFNEDFNSLKVQGEHTWDTVLEYLQELSPELVERAERWEAKEDIFHANRVDEQLAKAFERKVFLPSGGTLVIDRTEAMTVIDVNTGKFTGRNGGSLEETVTKNNLEAAEEIVRQLRLRDIGGIVVIDFIDMVLEANRDLVLRRLIECLGRDRTRHQVAEVTSLGLVQMTRKRVGQGLVEAFSTVCPVCEGRGYVTYDHPLEKGELPDDDSMVVGAAAPARSEKAPDPEAEAKQAEVKAALNSIAAAGAHKHKAKDAVEAPEEKEAKETPAERPAADASAHKAAAERPAADAPAKAASSRLVTSSGTITPASSGSGFSGLMSFPIKK